MEPFQSLNSVPAAPLEAVNVDTDQIVPARFLKYARRDGFGGFLFRDQRFTDGDAELPDFVLNKAPFRAAKVLVANTNFGCGSSREAAVYALYDFGFRTVIAPSFGDIFRNNCHKNGLLPVVLPDAVIADWRDKLAAGGVMSVDLAAQTVTGPDGTVQSFDIAPFWKNCLLKGLDDISLTRELEPDIAAFETKHLAANPWAGAVTV